VKQFTIVSFLLVSLLIITSAKAQIQYYGIDTIIKDGSSSVKLTITFLEPEESFSFNVIGKIQRFSVSSEAGPVDCDVTANGISFIDCSLSLTEEKRTVEIEFETGDFVKISGERFFFVADLSLNKDISSVFASVKLPEGMALVGEDVTGRISFPENTTIISDGRHHIVIWRLSDISKDQILKFQIIYEKITSPPLFQLRLRYFVIFGIAAAATIGLIYIRYFRKPEKLVLSVLDDFERKVLKVIVSAGGETKQKKVVQETNLSKAKVSRVIKTLVDRGLIEVERIGRTNKLKLIKKKLKL